MFTELTNNLATFLNVWGESAENNEKWNEMYGLNNTPQVRVHVVYKGYDCWGTVLEMPEIEDSKAMIRVNWNRGSQIYPNCKDGAMSSKINLELCKEIY